MQLTPHIDDMTDEDLQERSQFNPGCWPRPIIEQIFMAHIDDPDYDSHCSECHEENDDYFRQIAWTRRKDVQYYNLPLEELSEV